MLLRNNEDENEDEILLCSNENKIPLCGNEMLQGSNENENNVKSSFKVNSVAVTKTKTKTITKTKQSVGFGRFENSVYLCSETARISCTYCVCISGSTQSSALSLR